MKYSARQDQVVSKCSHCSPSIHRQLLDYNRENQSFLMHFRGLTLFFNQIGPQVEVICSFLC